MELARVKVTRSYSEDGVTSGHGFRVWIADVETNEHAYYYFDTPEAALDWCVEHNDDELTGISAFGIEGLDIDGSEGWTEWYDDDGEDADTLVSNRVYGED
jgi:hypothetical protein